MISKDEIELGLKRLELLRKTREMARKSCLIRKALKSGLVVTTEEVSDFIIDSFTKTKDFSIIREDEFGQRI